MPDFLFSLSKDIGTCHSDKPYGIMIAAQPLYLIEYIYHYAARGFCII